MAHPETVLVNAIREALKDTCPGAVIIKVHGSPFMATGLPDLLMWHRSLAYAFEVKKPRPGESIEHARYRTTPSQRLTIMKMRAAGVIADCVISPAEAVSLVAGHPYFLDLEIPLSETP